MEETYPRELSSFERPLLLWVLPADRSGYASYRSLVERWKVIGNGRRGDGNFILGERGRIPDVESPLPQVFAYGVLVRPEGNVTISVRERFEDQLEFEVTGSADDESAGVIRENRRWTYSDWVPRQRCPACGGTVRETMMRTASGHQLVLAICRADERLWAFDDLTRVNHLIPVTGFYNELMLQAGIHDPAIALSPKRLFAGGDTFSDSDLTRAFIAYNAMRVKVVLDSPLLGGTTGAGMSWITRLRRSLLRG